MPNIIKRFSPVKQLLSVLQSDARKYILKYNYLLIVTLLLFQLFIFSQYIDIRERNAIQTLNTIDKLYEGYVDRDEYCKSIRCQYIYDDEYNLLLNVENYDDIHANSVGTFEYIENDFYMTIEHKDTTYLLNITTIVGDLFLSFAFYYVLLFISMVVLVYMVLHRERSGFIEELNAKENDLQYSMLFNVALNINHNLRSPLMVISSVISEFIYITEMVRKNNLLSKQCELDLDECDELTMLAKTALGQINDAIAPLSDYKIVKFSNGDKSMYDLVSISLSMIKRTNLSTFKDFYIDEDLRMYNVYHGNGMENSTFINMLSNHIKNSLEAASTSINIYIHDITATHIYIYIEDDGTGIEKTVRDKIYDKNITTKAINSLDRGLGLYLNLFLLNNRYEGDDFLVNTEIDKGSTFCLKIRYNYREADI